MFHSVIRDIQLVEDYQCKGLLPAHSSLGIKILAHFCNQDAKINGDSCSPVLQATVDTEGLLTDAQLRGRVISGGHLCFQPGHRQFWGLPAQERKENGLSDFVPCYYTLRDFRLGLGTLGRGMWGCSWPVLLERAWQYGPG